MRKLLLLLLFIPLVSFGQDNILRENYYDLNQHSLDEVNEYKYVYVPSKIKVFSLGSKEDFYGLSDIARTYFSNLGFTNLNKAEYIEFQSKKDICEILRVGIEYFKIIKNSSIKDNGQRKYSLSLKLYNCSSEIIFLKTVNSGNRKLTVKKILESALVKCLKTFKKTRYKFYNTIESVNELDVLVASLYKPEKTTILESQMKLKEQIADLKEQLDLLSRENRSSEIINTNSIIEIRSFSLDETKDLLIEYFGNFVSVSSLKINKREGYIPNPYNAAFEEDFIRLSFYALTQQSGGKPSKGVTRKLNSNLFDFSKIYDIRIDKRGQGLAYLNIWVNIKNERKGTWEKYKLTLQVNGHYNAELLNNALKHYHQLMLEKKGAFMTDPIGKLVNEISNNKNLKKSELAGIGSEVIISKDDAKKQLLELKEYLDLGIITQEDFDKKAVSLKKILLGN